MKVVLRIFDSLRAAVLADLVKKLGGEVVEEGDDICLFEGRTADLKRLLVDEETYNLLSASAVGDLHFLLLERRAA